MSDGTDYRGRRLPPASERNLNLEVWSLFVLTLSDGRKAARWGDQAYVLRDDGTVDFEQPVPLPDDYEDPWSDL